MFESYLAEKAANCSLCSVPMDFRYFGESVDDIRVYAVCPRCGARALPGMILL